MSSRRMSSFADATDDVDYDDETGEIGLKPLKATPIEFSKPVIERAKLTFYEVMSDSAGSTTEMSSNSFLPNVSTSSRTSIRSVKPLFSPKQNNDEDLGMSARKSSTLRPFSSPSKHG